MGFEDGSVLVEEGLEGDGAYLYLLRLTDVVQLMISLVPLRTHSLREALLLLVEKALWKPKTQPSQEMQSY